MTLDFSTMPPPEEWDRFNAMIQRRMPRAPDMGDGAGTPMGDALMVAGAATSGLGDTLPPGVGTVVGLAGTTYSVGSTLSRGDVEGAAGALGDDLISRGADLVLAGEGGWLALKGGGLEGVERVGGHGTSGKGRRRGEGREQAGGSGLHGISRAAPGARPVFRS